MSAIQSAPSGPVLSIVGRNQLSLEAQELALGTGGGAMAAEAHPVGLEHHEMDKVVHRLADEQARRKLQSKQLVAVRGRAVC